MRAWGHYHPEFPVKDSHTHRDIIKIMHDAEYKSISLQKEEEWQRTQVTITASLFRTRIPPVFWNAVCAQFPLGMKFKSLSLMTTAIPNLSIFLISGKRQKNTEVLFTKEGKGAGYARNIGLSHARGKWIIFADADDFFTADCFTILNEYMDSPPWSHLFQCTFCHVRQSVPRKPTRNLLYQLLQWCKPGKQTAIPISSSLGQNDKAQLPVNIPHSIRWNKNSQRCVFSCLVGIYAPKATTDRRIIIIVPNPASPLLCPNKTARV